MNEIFLTPDEVADLLKVSYKAALDFIKYSGVDYIRIGKQYRVSESKLKSFLMRKGQIAVDISASIDI